MEWNKVKAKPNNQKNSKQDNENISYGCASRNHLRTGPVKQTFAAHDCQSTNKQASAIADFDYLRDDEEEEIKYDKISLNCAKPHQKVRLEKEMTKLAKAVNEKTGTIVDIESGEAACNSNVITRIEKVLGVKIPRGRGGQK